MAGQTVDQLAKEIEDQYLALKREKLKALETFEKYRSTRQCEFIRWYKWQKKVLKKIKDYNIILVVGPNKLGKSATIANVAISWALGYEPWTRSAEEKEGYIKADGQWYKPSSLGKEPPVRIRITGNDWRSHINETIIPEFVKWMPKDLYETRSDNGMVCKVIWNNGSTFEFLSHAENPSVFESWIGDGWIPDEPPNKEIFDAMGRGLFLNHGKVLMFTTLLTQPWIVDTLIEPEEPRDDVFVLDGLTFLDNDDLKEYDTKLLMDVGLTEKQVEQYFKLILDFEDKTKPQHIRSVNDYLKECLQIPLQIQQN